MAKNLNTEISSSKTGKWLLTRSDSDSETFHQVREKCTPQDHIQRILGCSHGLVEAPISVKADNDVLQKPHICHNWALTFGGTWWLTLSTRRHHIRITIKRVFQVLTSNSGDVVPSVAKVFKQRLSLCITAECYTSEDSFWILRKKKLQSICFSNVFVSHL